jgi:Xaa-Pro aminopeptidase
MDSLRYSQLHNKGLSFDTISGGGPNGAIIHYRPTRTNSSKITKNMIHLLDSGGQYLDGTTDVTRAFHFGTPT